MRIEIEQLDLERFWLMSPELHSTRVAKETQSDTRLLARILWKRKRNPKELIALREFPFTEAARAEFVPLLRSGLKINFK